MRKHHFRMFEWVRVRIPSRVNPLHGLTREETPKPPESTPKREIPLQKIRGGKGSKNRKIHWRRKRIVIVIFLSFGPKFVKNFQKINRNLLTFYNNVPLYLKFLLLLLLQNCGRTKTTNL